MHCASYDLFVRFGNAVLVRRNMKRPEPNIKYAGTDRR
jgi:hypothetical protein